MAPNGLVGLAVSFAPDDGGAPTDALLLIRTDDASFEKLYALPPWPDPGTLVVGVGWDGEAFAVHGFGAQNVQYVTRIAPDGTVLLAPTAFGQTFGYAEEVRYVTDPVSGVSYAVSGRLAPFFPWLTGHLKDGTHTPDPTKIQGLELKPQNFGPDGGWAGGVDRPCITAFPAGAAVAWSTTSSVGDPITTFVQPVGSTLGPTVDAIGIPGEQLPPPAEPGAYDGHVWLTIQPHPTGGWWLAGSNTMTINEIIVDPTGKSTRRVLVSFSASIGFAVSDFESVRYGDELWLGFLDASSAKEQPFRVIRAKAGCTYKSMFDLLAG